MRVPDGKGTKGHYSENMSRVIQLNPHWNYSWGCNVAPNQPPAIEFLPMFWGRNGFSLDANGKPMNPAAGDVMTDIKAGKVKRLLGFNEPDKKEQGNMPFQDVISYWPLLEPFGVPLCSPSCANPEGMNDDSVQNVPCSSPSSPRRIGRPRPRRPTSRNPPRSSHS